MADIEKNDYLKKARFHIVVPADLDLLTSTTSYCEHCYKYQMFSNRLQRFMIDYSLSVSSGRPRGSA